MRISLKFDWAKYVFKIARVYSLSLEVKKIINKIFDKLHDQERLS